MQYILAMGSSFLVDCFETGSPPETHRSVVPIVLFLFSSCLCTIFIWFKLIFYHLFFVRRITARDLSAAVKCQSHWRNRCKTLCFIYLHDLHPAGSNLIEFDQLKNTHDSQLYFFLFHLSLTVLPEYLPQLRCVHHRRRRVLDLDKSPRKVFLICVFYYILYTSFFMDAILLLICTAVGLMVNHR